MKDSAKSSKANSPAKSSKANSPAKSSKANSPAKSSKANSPAKSSTANSPAKSSTANSPSNPKENEMDELLKIEVPCITKEGKPILVRAALLHQSKLFKNLWQDLNMTSKATDELKDFVFPVENVSSETFSKVADWLTEHAGKPVPVIEEDPATRERKGIKLTEWEHAFFKINIDELVELLKAANYLDIPSLYIYTCQAVAALIKDQTVEKIRETFGLEDNMTEEEKTEVRRKNVWCQY